MRDGIWICVGTRWSGESLPKRALRLHLQYSLGTKKQEETIFKVGLKMRRIISILFIFLLLAGCSMPALQTATPDVDALYTAAVATAYAELTLSPVSTPASASPPTPPSTPLPSAITDEFGVPMVLVPGGPFLMGRGENNDSPTYLEVTVGDYYIDKYEVTNASYRACVEARVCEPPYHEGSYTHESYYLNSDFANYPVLSNPRSPKTYCKWRGAHLVTEIEWEKAMRGTDGRTYPWGNDQPDGTRANLCDSNCYQKDKWSMNDGFTDVAPVGSFPAGASPYGVMDLVGNVNEEVSESPELSEYREVLSRVGRFVGGAYDTGPSGASYYSNYSLGSWYHWFNIGFRCAREISEPVNIAVILIGPTLTPLPTSPPSTPLPINTPLPTSTSTPTATIRPEFLSAKVYPIAFVSEAADRSMSLKLINADGSGLRTLFPLQQELSALMVHNLAWSPDGKTLYFTAQLSETVESRAYQVAPFETDPEKQVYRAIEGLPNLNYSNLILSPDGRYLSLVYSLYPGDEGYLGAVDSEHLALGIFDLKTKVWKPLPIPNYYAGEYEYGKICLTADGWSPNSSGFTFTAHVNLDSAQSQEGVALISYNPGAGNQPEAAELFVARVSGEVKKLTKANTDLSLCPVWTAGGKQIIFIGIDDWNTNLTAIRPDGSGATLIHTLYNPQQYQLSPDGLHLALAANSELWHQAANPAGMFKDFNETDGMGRSYFGLHPWELISKIGEDASLSWSPNNRQIAFQCDDQKSICTISAECKDEKGDCPYSGENDLLNLTNGALPGYGPIWSPDGLRIAYIAKSQGNYVLVVMNNDGSEQRILVKDAALQMEIGLYRWSPQPVTP